MLKALRVASLVCKVLILVWCLLNGKAFRYFGFIFGFDQIYKINWGTLRILK